MVRKGIAMPKKAPTMVYTSPKYTMKTYINNKKAYFNYEILKEFEAGLVLKGTEVKALKAGRGSLAGAYIIVRGGEAYLIGSDIPPYQIANVPKDYDAKANRKLLLSKKEISVLAGYESQRGLTIVPLSLYNKGSHLKLSIGVARGKKLHDKREVIKKRDTDRDIQRTLKNQ